LLAVVVVGCVGNEKKTRQPDAQAGLGSLWELMMGGMGGALALGDGVD